jgi:hypothetical protein
VTNRAPTHIPQNVAAGGGANFVPPAHTTHFSNTFAGSSSSSRQSAIDDVLYEMRAQNARNEERDGLFNAMHQQQEVMMGHMRSMQAQQTEILQNQHQMQGLLQQMGELRRALLAVARQCHTRARRLEASAQQLPKLSTASPMIFSFQVLRSNSTLESQQ